MTPLRRLSGEATAAAAWQQYWQRHWPHTRALLLLAATATAEVPGISAAGATPESRRRTAAADAELLLLGPEAERPHALPPLPAGVSPALIAHVVVRELGLEPLVIDLGCPVAPAVPHLRPGSPAAEGPAACVSGGAAMSPERVAHLLRLGRRWGEALGRRSGSAPLLLAECVPGGTTTALALLRGLGVEADGLVSGSLPLPAHGLKAALVARGLAAARPGDPAAVVAAVGDPMQPMAAGLLLGSAGLPTILAGGSQMAAVLALALALATPAERTRLTAAAAVVTTAWVVEEAGSDLTTLLERIGARWQVRPLAFAADLRFHGPLHPALGDYERGFVKEGVGAGGLALLWQLSGRRPGDLAAACDRACRALERSGLPSPHG